MDGIPVAVNFHAQRVYQERHVVSRNLYNSVWRLPAVFFVLGSVDTHFTLPQSPPLAELPVSYDRSIKVVRTALGEIFWSNPTIVLTCKCCNLCRFVLRKTLLDAGENLLKRLSLDGM